MLPTIQNDTRTRMNKSLEALRHELAKIRTGRAHPSLLEHVHVEYYGNEVPINQAASVAIEDARTLSVSPWDKNMVKAIEKAILTSDLGLNPNTAGQVIRIPLPPLTEERRKDLVKIVHKLAEEGRISIRHAREDARAKIKKVEHVSEDEKRRSEGEIQTIHDEAIAEIEEIVKAKEAEIMEV